MWILWQQKNYLLLQMERAFGGRQKEAALFKKVVHFQEFI